MAYYSIEKRLTSAGDVRYRCTVGVKQDGKYIHRERKTFSKQSLAKAWGVNRVADIEQNGLPLPAKSAAKTLTLGELIQKYMDHPHVKFGRSKRETLNLVLRTHIATIPLNELTTSSYIDHAAMRRTTVQPSTAAHDINYIGKALSSAKPLFDISIDYEAFLTARETMRQMGIIGTGNTRSRRPTGIELDRIIERLKEKTVTSYSGAPFADILMFSVLSCMRIGEVTRIQWSDVDKKNRAVLVRDRKDPRKKQGNHMVVPLLGQAWEILENQPKKGDYVFPFKERSLTQTFRQVTKELGVEDLHYHDLRREGASRLFEAGFSLEEVAQVTGHKSLDILWKVYREIYPQTLHDKFELLKSKPQG
jgi:integrase